MIKFHFKIEWIASDYRIFVDCADGGILEGISLLQMLACSIKTYNFEDGMFQRGVVYTKADGIVGSMKAQVALIF